MLPLTTIFLILAMMSDTFADNEQSTTFSPENEIPYPNLDVEINDKRTDFILTVYIGEPEQKARFRITLKHADIWIVSDLCTTATFCREKDKKVFEIGKSRSLTREGISKYNYDDYEVSMDKAKDIIRISKQNIYNQTFGLVKNITTKNVFGFYQYINYSSIDGVVGFGLTKPETLGKSLLDNMFEQNIIPTKLFSITINEFSNGLSLSFGYNSDYYTGVFSYVNLISDEYYKIRVNRFLFNGDHWVDSFEASIDESYSIAIPGMTYDRFMFTIFDMPCNSFPDLTFVIGSQEYLVQADHYVLQARNECYPRIIKSKNNEWTLGLPFLSSVYTVFDIQNHRIGVAHKKNV